jgi:hypothetical protein
MKELIISAKEISLPKLILSESKIEIKFLRENSIFEHVRHILCLFWKRISSIVNDTTSNLEL